LTGPLTQQQHIKQISDPQTEHQEQQIERPSHSEHGQDHDDDDLVDSTLLRELTDQQRKKLTKLVKQETFILRPMSIVVFMWSISLILNLAEVGIFYPVHQCDTSWWSYTIIEYPIFIILTIIITWITVQRYTKKRILHWVPDSGDIEWNTHRAIVYPLAAMLAGGLGGLVGIGGGMIVSPMLLQIGVAPRVTSATSAIAVAVTSSSGILQKILLGQSRYDYTFYYMGVGAVGTFFGQISMHMVLKRYGRQSFIIFSVEGMMVLALFLMGIKGIISLIQGNNTFTFYPIC